jgi:hypothetical protein
VSVGLSFRLLVCATKPAVHEFPDSGKDFDLSVMANTDGRLLHRLRPDNSALRPARRIGCRGLGPMCRRAEAGCRLGDGRQDIEKVARRSRQAIDPRHHEHVVGVELGEHRAELGRDRSLRRLRSRARLSPLAASDCRTCASMLWPYTRA